MLWWGILRHGTDSGEGLLYLVDMYVINKKGWILEGYVHLVGGIVDGWAWRFSI